MQSRPTEFSRRHLICASGAALGLFAGRTPASQPAVDDASVLWSDLEKAPWISGGGAAAQRIVYVFSDPNCIWCHRFWEASRPWVDAGKVQLRYLIVGLVRPDSARKAAAILGAKDPAQAIQDHEKAYDRGGVSPLPAVPENTARTLENNLRLMRSIGFRGTPALVYRDARGEVTAMAGFPKTEDGLASVLGKR
ncbi:thioredoxin-like protein [Pseudorhodoferax soli]|uniref:Thiol:disulfide interchange protein n=2 Tax=Pseudorhodoferax soli TaxID=545864 RepID=A0A368XNK1_9BURK|nr:thioredoxin-like protein [Pseudorhodoferax soli]